MALEDAKKQVDTAITRDGFKGGLSFENTFGGVTSFLRRTLTKDLTGVDLAVTGIPFDQAVTNRPPGTRLGPRAIREASALQSPDAPYGWGGFDPLSEFAIADYGDLAFDYAMWTSSRQRLRPISPAFLIRGGRPRWCWVATIILPSRSCGRTPRGTAPP